MQFKKNVIDKNGKEKEIKIDCTDLLILRWFVDFYPKMMKVEIEGVQYAWVKYQRILGDLPLLDIKKQALFDRLKKMCEFKILKHKTIKVDGTFSYYGFGEMYDCLIDTDSSQTSEGEYSTNEGIDSQLHKGKYSTNEQINSSIKDQSIKDSSIKDIKYIVDYLNEKAGTKYRASTPTTQNLLKALLTGKNPFTVEDCILVIDKQCAKWKGTEWEQYLRPSTLFGKKFENYLNAKNNAPNTPQQKDANRIRTAEEYRQGQEGEDYF